MINKLRLNFDAILGASPKQLGFNEDAQLGSVQLAIVMPSRHEPVEVMTVNWDICAPLTWLRENKKYLLDEDIPPFIEWGGSIHHSIEKFWDREDFSDAEEDQNFNYRKRHELCFAFRGIQIPTIYIGKGIDGWEVSGVREETQFFYRVDLPEFFDDLDKKFPSTEDGQKINY
ncbi:hypothetical protein [Cupriavidus sp. DL-D2]|uniref:hypothetical protein n=1 Tax=Cupriavidus sp. DL-D2 TaxID=3144974 RepID=UPI003214CC15